ncbi:hypothetical protein ABZY04_26220, partial [Streptomyces sp. NPDC002922]
MHRPMDEPVDAAMPSGTRPHPSETVSHWPTVLPPVGDIPDPARVDPAVLGALLDRHGWRRRGGSAGRYSRWTPPGTVA